MATTPTSWQRIAEDITTRITTGETPPGEKIASISELATRHNTSPGTVKKAIDHLKNAGVLTGIQGVGTFATRQPTPNDTKPAPTLEQRVTAIEQRLAALEQKAEN